MESNPDSSNSLKKALLRALLCLVIFATGVALLTLVALYVPDNYLGHYTRNGSDHSKLEAWFPDQSVLPGDMLLIASGKSDNDDIARSYDDQDEMEKRLDGFGREEGFIRRYAARDRCKLEGIRTIQIGLVQHKDPVGAQAYHEWLRAKDSKTTEMEGPVQVGNSGYQLRSTSDSLCPPNSEVSVEVHFRRDNLLGSVLVYAAKGTNQEEDLLNVALAIAGALDANLQQKALKP